MIVLSCDCDLNLVSVDPVRIIQQNVYGSFSRKVPSQELSYKKLPSIKLVQLNWIKPLWLPSIQVKETKCQKHCVGIPLFEKQIAFFTKNDLFCHAESVTWRWLRISMYSWRLEQTQYECKPSFLQQRSTRVTLPNQILSGDRTVSSAWPFEITISMRKFISNSKISKWNVSP